MPFGSLVGALSSSFIADRYSRRTSIQIASVFWVIGSMYIPRNLCDGQRLTWMQYSMRFSRYRYASRWTSSSRSLCRNRLFHLPRLSIRNSSKGNPWSSCLSTTMGYNMGVPPSLSFSPISNSSHSLRPDDIPVSSSNISSNTVHPG